MSEEKRTQGSSGSSGKGGGRKNKRRYFRRKGKSSGGGGAAGDAKPEAKPEQNESAQGESKSRKGGGKRRSGGTGGTGGPGADIRAENQEARRKRRSRRRSSNRRKRGEADAEMPQVVEIPETPGYVEPSAVYVHTHIVRPAYRDSAAEYRSEALSHFTGSGTVLNEAAMERLAGEINQQLDDWFTRQAEPPRRIRLEELDLGDERYADYVDDTDEE